MPIVADVVWPGLFLGVKLVGLTVILVGLLVEFCALWLVLKFPWPKAILADVVMNLVSVVPGAVLLGIASVGWEIFPGIAMYQWLGVGTFNPVTWSATFVMAVLINASLESATLRFVFKYPFSRKVLVTLLVANSVSVAVAGVGLYLKPLDL